MGDDRLASVKAALLREIGPPAERDDMWQPMVSAGEVRTLLDALAAAEARAETLSRQVATCGALAEKWKAERDAPFGEAHMSFAFAAYTLLAALNDPSSQGDE